MDRRRPILASIVLSFRNEAENIPALVARIERTFAAESDQYEIIFVNDASTDASLEAIRRERDRNPRVKAVNLARRFGVAAGVLAGMAAATGDVVVYMDADLQDPPEVIPALIGRWRGGAEVVHTVRTKRHGESRLQMWAARVAYRIINAGSELDLPIEAGDFKLLSRAAVDHLLRLRETDPYLRGLVVWLGFAQVFVPYERQPRAAGKTHFPFFSWNPWKTFASGVTSFSFLPIYACLALAVVGLIASLLLALAGAAFAALLTFFWATTMGALGGVGAYVARIYKDVRGRPPYIVESTLGFQEREVMKS